MINFSNLTASIIAGFKIPDAVDFLSRRYFESGENVLILLYHRVATTSDDWELPAIPPSVFEAQMDFIKKFYQPISLSTYTRYLLGQEVLPARRGRRYVVITFDDGYLDNYEYAYPILNKYQIPATFFVTTGLIDGTSSIWTTRLSYMIFHSSKAPISFRGIPLNLSTKKSKTLAYERLIRYLGVLSGEECENMLTEFGKACGVTNLPPSISKCMTWVEVAEIGKNPLFQIGAHTLSHPNLAGIFSTEKMKDEIKNSRDIILEKVGTVGDSFAYPFGEVNDINDLAVNTVKQSGFQSAVTTIYGLNSSGQDRFLLKRITAPYTLSKLKIKISPIFGWFNF